MYDIIKSAELRLEERAKIARQIMEDIKAMNITLNDDDWYIFDTVTNELVEHWGSHVPRFLVHARLEPGQTALRGLAIKMRGIELWRDVK